jgi:hypothetical protein
MNINYFTSKDFAVISIMILALLITVIIFLKLGRPSKWFKKE